MKPKNKSEAYNEIKCIYRMMHKAGVTCYVTSFGIQRIMREWDISSNELDTIRRQVIREMNYKIYDYE